MNAAVAGLGSTEHINEACLDLQKSSKKQAGPGKVLMQPTTRRLLLLDLIQDRNPDRIVCHPVKLMQGEARACGCSYLHATEPAKAERFQVRCLQGLD